MSLNLKESEKLFEKAHRLAPGGVHSPVRAFRSVGGTPVFIKSGHGATITDEDDNSYVDFCMSWGALSMGHAHPKVVENLREQVLHGTHYGTPTRWDVELAEMVLARIPHFDRVRFVSSGTEAVMTAVRLARGYTSRNKILKMDGSYHGHLDSLLVSAGSGLVTQGLTSSSGVTKGTTQDTLVAKSIDIEALENAFKEYPNDIAALIVEPVLANNGLFELGSQFLNDCRKLCTKYGALLIFDEVITGFRVAPGGAQERYEVQADIATYGKIIGGGLPVGAVAAHHTILSHLAPEGSVYQAGTLSGNPLAMVAGLSTLEAMKQEQFFTRTEELGQTFDSEISSHRNRLKFHYKRVGSIFWLAPSEAPLSNPSDIGEYQKSSYKVSFHRLLEQGYYTAPSVFEVGFLCPYHTVEQLREFIRKVLD
ncbi:MAG: aspartate aminotransferase family protein [Bdellovibrionales bacterium CG10_big_fil_rev_8_21_14_0_10_45_34]|nr:MAG: aspartate aminotransferase family protein [Bdellovibrionales bacterium CG10_big_fil_rev_8_21_14_0_10_45_34]